MKTTKRLIAMAAALTLTACAAAPITMMNVGAADTSSITIDGTYSTEHTFEIYQVMTGKYDSGSGKFSELKWGADVTKYGGDNVNEGTDVTDVQLTAISAITDAGTLPSGLTLKTTGRKYADKTGSSDVAFTGLAEGYYIIKDVTDLSGKDDANSAWIVQVAGTTTIAIKNAKPTVDKQVYDNADGSTVAAWGETADHALNESFQFKLVATIPADADLKEYSTYKLKFNDTMSSGVTFESIASVKINNTEISTTGSDTASKYTVNGVETGDAGKTWSLEIDDVKKTAGATVWGNSSFEVEIIYNAHLNENAFIDTKTRTGGTSSNTNNNMVNLEYSNNPDSTGSGETGKTTDDYVWVFTYKVDNTKYKINDSDGNELAGATFSLKKGDASVSLIYDSTLNAYRPIKTGETATLMTSSAEPTMLGQFNIVGLDAGTYTIHEEAAPTGYNEAADVTFTIGATHSEQTDETKADVTLTGIGDGVENKIVDTKNSSLPTTGGTGTKVLYAIGGTILVGAGMVLVSKKRAQK